MFIGQYLNNAVKLISVAIGAVSRHLQELIETFCSNVALGVLFELNPFPLDQASRGRSLMYRYTNFSDLC